MHAADVKNTSLVASDVRLHCFCFHFVKTLPGNRKSLLGTNVVLQSSFVVVLL